MRRRLAFPVALAVAGALACGGGSSKNSGGSVGKACSAASQCGSGLVCVAGKCATTAPTAASCASPGSAPSAPTLGDAIAVPDPGGACDSSIREPVAPAAQSLGQLQVGQTVPFDVPENTWSVTIVSQMVPGSGADTVDYLGTPIPNSVVPTDVKAPDGQLFYSDTPDRIPSDANHYPDYTGFLGYYGGFTPRVGSLTLPNASPGLDEVRSAGALPAGRWTFTVNDYAYECPQLSGCSVTDPRGSTAGRYDVRVITRGGPIASTGTLDLDVYVASAPDPTAKRPAYTAAGLSQDPRATRLFRTIASVLGHAGICLGSVTLHDLPQWARDRYAIVNVDSTGPCDALSQLFTLAQAPRSSVHLFLIDELTVTASDNNQYQVVGIDGSIPGPSGVPGTINGGAVAQLANLGDGTCGSSIDLAHCGVDQVAYIAAHEIGHWLGLYHTTERSGTLFDPLRDTPTCACTQCAPASQRSTCSDQLTDPQATPFDMTGDECSQTGDTCSGAQNLMFWLLDDQRSTGALTAEQAEVMRLNPAIR